MEAGSSDPARASGNAGSKDPASIRRSFAAIVIGLCTGTVLSACPICFQVEDTGVVDGVRAAVIVLGGVTGSVLVGVAVFARRLVKAERQ
jgi:hypothetical protein